jgi:hypothetical protein
MIRNFVCALIVLCAGAACLAQTGTTSIRGVLTDKSGAAIVGANVTLASTEQSLQREAKSDATGEYRFLGLPPGSYNVTVTAPGFRQLQKRFDLLVNVPVTQNFQLAVGSTEEKVEISAEAETVNTTDASLGNAFNQIAVKELPLESRNVPDLLSLQAGVLYTGVTPQNNTDTRSGAVEGARSDQSNITVDGIPANPKGGYAFQSVLPETPDSLEEFRVTTNNYGADQGVSSGAQVALVTKSGTDQFHGSAYEYNRNSAFSANDYFLKSAQLASGEANKPLHLNRNIFGGSLGGPILKNRLYFFMNYEGYRDSEAQSAVRTVPTASLRDGVIEYLCGPGGAACPGNTATGVDGKPFSVSAGYAAVGATTLTQWDSGSQGPTHGPNAVVLNYMNQAYPLPNDFTQGDGLNTAGYRFSAPTKNVKNWYIAKLDYNITADSHHRVSVSGALANEANSGAPFLPGTAPEYTTVNFNKGIIANYTAVLSSSLLNNFHYGFIRESLGTIGDSNKPWNYLEAFDQGVTRSSEFQRPIHTFTDDLSWNKGKHTWQFGFQMSLLRNPVTNYNNSFSVAAANSDWMANSGIANPNNQDPLNPDNHVGSPFVAASFANGYSSALTSMMGMMTIGEGIYNYNRQGQQLADGAPVSRRFAEDSYEMYAQDTWKLKPNLTVTAGLRYSLFSPPWETSGLEVTPTINVGQWFNQRGQGMLNGTPSNQAPLLSYDWAGKANGKSGYYNWDFKDFSPRLAVAYAPNPKTSIRGGFGIVYDRAGESLIDSFDQFGSFGLSTQVNNPSAVETSVIAPRLTDMNTLPTVDYAGNAIIPAATPPQYPLQYPVGTGAITWGIDQNLKTPYSYTVDLSVSHEFKDSYTLEMAYVGRFARHLLAQDDLAMPLNIYDKKAGIDYFTAEQALAKVFRPQLQAGVTDPTVLFMNNWSKLPANVQQFWKDQIQPLQAGGAYTLNGCTGSNGTMSTTNPIIFAFDTFCSTGFNDSLGLYLLDEYGSTDYNNPNQQYYFSGGQYSYYSPQFSSLYAWRSMAWSNYNGLQTSLRHRMKNGIQFDLNYTYSKSIDISSDAERVGAASNGSLQGLNNNIINAWNPNAQKGPSSFDARSQLNANWVWEMPFGRGRRFASNANRALDALVGDWQLTGLFRWTSGLPVTVDNGFSAFPTNFEMEGNANQVASVKTGSYIVNGVPNLFSNPQAALNSFAYAYAGQSGQRNEIRGPGFFGINMGLSKSWKMPWNEKHSLQFRWETFNVTNTTRFDVQSALLSNNLSNDSGNSFGKYSSTLSTPRIMEFALRYQF